MRRLHLQFALLTQDLKIDPAILSRQRKINRSMPDSQPADCDF